MAENKKVEVTRLVSHRRYPTYQFHGFTDNNKSLNAEDAFKICILEVISWFKKRNAENSINIEEIDLPEPYNYKNIDLDNLNSFRFESGYTLDVVFIPDIMLWSFYLLESDNNVTAEDKSINSGRIFETNVSFRISGDVVEVGVQIVCSEPITNTSDCDVFRPLLIKNIANNPLLGLRKNAPLPKYAIEVNTNNEMKYLEDLIADQDVQMPIVFVIDLPENPKSNKKENFVHTRTFDSCFVKKPLELDLFKTIAKKDAVDELLRVHKDAVNADNAISDTTVKPNEYMNSLAGSLQAFAYFYLVNEKYYDKISKLLKSSQLQYGDIIVLEKSKIIHTVSYSNIQNNCQDEIRVFKEYIKKYPKRRNIDFGNVLFNNDAKIYEITHRSQDMKNSMQVISNLQEELNQMREKEKQYNQILADRMQLSDENQRMDSSIKKLESRMEKLEKLNIEMNSESAKLKGVINLKDLDNNNYKNKVSILQRVPISTKDICKWIADTFSGTILLHKDAINSMREYDGGMDPNILCDGIIFLDAYVKNRRGEITKEELDFYAADNNWSVTLAGKSTQKHCRDEYEIEIDSGNGKTKKLMMDLHIKDGVNHNRLIRVYFAWDDGIKKIVIGHMPDHLETVTKF